MTTIICMRIQPRHIIRQDQTSSPSIWFIKPCRCVHLRTQKTEREREHTLFSEKINNCGRPGSWALSTVCNPRFPLLNGPEGPNRHSIHQLMQNGLANPTSTRGGVDISKDHQHLVHAQNNTSIFTSQHFLFHPSPSPLSSSPSPTTSSCSIAKPPEHRG